MSVSLNGWVSIKRLASAVDRFYAVRVEPLIYLARRQKRLRQFGVHVDSHSAITHLNIGQPGSCQNHFCEVLIQRYEKYYRRFRQFRPDASGRLRGFGTLAILDLQKFTENQGYLTQLRKESGNFYRDANKARRKGYLFNSFQYQNHTPDICEIRKSLKLRSFGLVVDAFVLTVESLGGAPDNRHPVSEPQCTRHWELFFGVFIEQAGYMQGSITTNEKLVAYVRLHRIGDTVRYAEFMGHGEYMRHGVMMLLHVNLVEWLLDPENRWASGVRQVTYGAIEQGSEGLFFWKKKALFVPRILSS